jgi:hypothetical protein
MGTPLLVLAPETLFLNKAPAVELSCFVGVLGTS